MKDLATQLNRNTFSVPVVLLMIVSTFGIGIIIGSGSNPIRLNDTSAAPYNEVFIRDLYNQVSEEYLGEMPDSKELTEGIAKGLVESLGDEYSAYLTPEEAKEYLDSNDSAFEGIGVQLSYNGQYSIVQTPIPGNPGQKAGMLPGDEILVVNGEDVAGQRPEIVAPKIRGKAGTTVKLKLYRASESRILELEIVRQRITLENITFKKLDNGVVVINIVKFTDGDEGGVNAVEVFNRNWDKIVDQVMATNPRGIVVDLRNNPGGFVNSVRHVAEEFLPQNSIIMSEQTKRGEKEDFRDYRNGELEKLPVSVIVNSGSASASEILAGAIQLNQRGKIIGEKTVGKGVEQRVTTLRDNSILMLVFKRWLLPDGRQLDKENPISPDFEVEFTSDDVTAGRDPQLAKAIEQLGL